jgi:hypothetical protein
LGEEIVSALLIPQDDGTALGRQKKRQRKTQTGGLDSDRNKGGKRKLEGTDENRRESKGGG